MGPKGRIEPLERCYHYKGPTKSRKRNNIESRREISIVIYPNKSEILYQRDLIFDPVVFDPANPITGPIGAVGPVGVVGTCGSGYSSERSIPKGGQKHYCIYCGDCYIK